jgi:hypothetical protein
MYQLSDNAEATTLGKLAIIHSILKAEKDSTIRLSRETGRPDDSAGRDGWVEQLFSMAIQGLKQSELHTAFDNLTFVNFNYDRCIEHYLFWSLQRIGVQQGQAEEIVSKLKMIRPYGGLGTSLPNVRAGIPYGADRWHNLFDVVDRIRTYTESALHDSELLDSALLGAELILFLGFGFHPQNLGLLKLGTPRDSVQVMATVKKIHSANLGELANALRTTLRVNLKAVELHDMTTPEMLRDLRLKIMMRVGS